MPYKACAAAFRGNNSNNIKQRGLDISFHNFSPETIPTVNLLVQNNANACSIYRSETDYEQVHYDQLLLQRTQQPSHAENLNVKNENIKDLELKLRKIEEANQTLVEHNQNLRMLLARLKYDTAADEIVRPHNYLQVVKARGLFHKWKQPVFLGFDKKMTKEIIITLIEKLSNANINVIGIVSDNAASNLSCWKELGDHDPAAPYFKHPTTNSNGQKFKPDLLLDLISKRNEAELTPLYKLNKSHLIMTSHERQHVRRAAQLLSRTTAISLRKYYPYNNEATKFADFIETIDLWFSISDSYTPLAKLDYKKSYSGNENQKKSLQDMFELISTMTIIDKPGMQIFQKSLLMQITSLGMIFDDMQRKHGISFISTHKNQTYMNPGPHLNEDESISAEQRVAIENENDAYHNESNEDFVLATLNSSGDIMNTLNEAEQDGNNMNSESSELLSTVSSTIVELPEQDSDGLEYVMGYIAFKYRDKFPELEL
uniref:Uncharacterized protein n=1 Tax=Anopheles dirus TaxID=7168 RepID=A0A182NVD6_9DIPT